MASIFYANYGLIASIQPEWFQGAFCVLTGLFNRAGLRNNVVRHLGWYDIPDELLE